MPTYIADNRELIRDFLIYKVNEGMRIVPTFVLCELKVFEGVHPLSITFNEEQEYEILLEEVAKECGLKLKCSIESMDYYFAYVYT